MTGVNQSTHVERYWPFFDLKKAFDTVCHEILFLKLPFYGSSQQSTNFIKGYLSAILFAFNILTLHLIKWTHLNVSIGPLLFIIYNDFCFLYLTSKVILFADDTSLSIEYEDIAELKKTVNID